MEFRLHELGHHSQEDEGLLVFMKASPFFTTASSGLIKDITSHCRHCLSLKHLRVKKFPSLKEYLDISILFLSPE